jgi:hypothetical protein
MEDKRSNMLPKEQQRLCCDFAVNQNKRLSWLYIVKIALCRQLYLNLVRVYVSRHWRIAYQPQNKTIDIQKK